MDDHQLKKGVDGIWLQHDVDNDGFLDREEAKQFVVEMLETNGQTFDQGLFDRMFDEAMDRGEEGAGDGKISRNEMAAFVREFME
mmetsp:Transcript_22520/g.25339  ORF Transcript_22520/g.25339 Transcript_22520/m.25339 type:complete len:85 (+) Transcript_22520:1586-1840(+)